MFFHTAVEPERNVFAFRTRRLSGFGSGDPLVAWTLGSARKRSTSVDAMLWVAAEGVKRQAAKRGTSPPGRDSEGTTVVGSYGWGGGPFLSDRTATELGSNGMRETGGHGCDQDPRMGRGKNVEFRSSEGGSRVLAAGSVAGEGSECGMQRRGSA